MTTTTDETTTRKIPVCDAVRPALIDSLAL
jgi:hypothetical protein